jgi:hypothetical protein
MANAVLTNSIIAKEALMVLENELVMAKKVYRGLEKEFDNRTNGYLPGATVTIKRPTDFTVRDGANASVQDVVEGSTSITVDQQKGIDFSFSSLERTLSIRELSERVIKPAMVQLANKIDVDLMAQYKYIPNWVGTPGQAINSFTDYALGPRRLDEGAVSQDGRVGILSPADHWGLLGTQTGLYIQGAANEAYRKGNLGMIGGVDTYMSQNVPTHTVGSDVTTVTVGAAITTSTIAYADVKTTMQQTITTAGGTLNAGDVFTIDDVYAVNPVSKATLPYLKQFTVISYTTNSAVIYPAMIWTGAFQNVAVSSGVTDLNTKAMTFMGTAGTSYAQNLIFNKNAFALAVVPMVVPDGAVNVTRESDNGLSVRMIPFYNGSSDVSTCRLDVLYGIKTLDPRLATRISGTS